MFVQTISLDSIAFLEHHSACITAIESSHFFISFTSIFPFPMATECFALFFLSIFSLSC